ncbi:MAG: PepSY domain-containing protein [Gammaproteobacteria bacterium]
MPKLKNTMIPAVLGLLIFSPVSLAAVFDVNDINACMNAAYRIQKRSGFIKLEQLQFKDHVVYEIEVQDPKGNNWELSCLADTGSIYQVAREVDKSDPSFTDTARISEKDAYAKARAWFPGDVGETEYEVRDQGPPLYEFDVVNRYGQTTRIEINAVTGEIVEAFVENWEIRWVWD